MNVDWKHYDTSRDVSILNNIFGSLPKQLRNLGPELVEHFRVAAGMVHLWGTSYGKGWGTTNETTGLTFNSDTIVRMLISYGLFRHEVADYKRIEVKKVKINTCNDRDVCDACQRLAGKIYKLSEVPEMPYEECTHEFGCRCWVGIDEY